MANFIVIDVETTGQELEADVIEIAALKLNPELEIIGEFHSMVRPRKPILPAARAVHHIPDSELENAPYFEQVEPAFAGFIDADDILVAHNAEFDSSFFHLPQPWVCTMRLARRLLREEAGMSYGLQFLRYHCGLDLIAEATVAPHRAAFDALTCATLFKHLMEIFRIRAGADGVPRDVQNKVLIELNRQPYIQLYCTFGAKHKGELWADVPRNYLTWMDRNVKDMDDDLRATVSHYLGQS